jgi:hypothetical protein
MRPVQAVPFELPPEAPPVPRFFERLQKLANHPRREPFDPSSLGDPVAMKTEWTTAGAAGTNLRTRRLVEAGPDRLEFRVSAGVILFVVFLLLQSLIPIALFGAFVYHAGLFTIEAAALCFGCLFYLVPSGLLLYYNTVPIVFDRLRGYFWKGRRAPDEGYDDIGVRKAARLTDVHALQIIAILQRSGRGSYYMYELNLVLKDGSRLNVVGHRDQPGIRKEASTLSRFLGKPVWDAT